MDYMKKSMGQWMLVVLCAGLCLVTGCGRRALTTDGLGQRDSGGYTTFPDWGGKRDVGTLALHLEPVENSTCHSTVALHGTATPDYTVLVTGGAKDQSVVADRVLGTFCMDVKLKPGQPNHLEVFLFHPDKGLSGGHQVTVEQRHCKPPAPVSTNVALGAKVVVNASAVKGKPGHLNDGKIGTVLVLEHSSVVYWIKPVWAKIQLPKVAEVYMVKVRWRDKKGDPSLDFATKYRLLVALGSDPTDPNLASGYWTEIGSITAGQGGVDTFDLNKNMPLAQHVVLWMDDSASLNTINPAYALAEVEIWTVPKQAKPQKPKTCKSLM